MEIDYGNGTTKYGPGVDIKLTGDEVAIAIHSWLVGQGIHIDGPRTIIVNKKRCEQGQVYVDPAGSVVFQGERISGRGPIDVALT